MTRVIRFDAPPPRGADPKINAYGSGTPRSPKIGTSELLGMSRRLLSGKTTAAELAEIQRRLDAAQGIEKPKTTTGLAPVTEHIKQAVAAIDAFLEERGAKQDPPKQRAEKAPSAEPDDVLDSSLARRDRAANRTEELAARLLAKGRAPLPALVTSTGERTAKQDQAQHSSNSSKSTASLFDRLVAKGREPLR